MVAGSVELSSVEIVVLKMKIFDRFKKKQKTEKIPKHIAKKKSKK